LGPFGTVDKDDILLLMMTARLLKVFVSASSGRCVDGDTTRLGSDKACRSANLSIESPQI